MGHYFLDTQYMGHSTLHVGPKYLTSPKAVSFSYKKVTCKFLNDRITFRALFGRFAGAAQNVPKRG